MVHFLLEKGSTTSSEWMELHSRVMQCFVAHTGLPQHWVKKVISKENSADEQRNVHMKMSDSSQINFCNSVKITLISLNESSNFK